MQVRLADFVPCACFTSYAPLQVAFAALENGQKIYLHLSVQMQTCRAAKNIIFNTYLIAHIFCVRKLHKQLRIFAFRAARTLEPGYMGIYI